MALWSLPSTSPGFEEEAVSLRFAEVINLSGVISQAFPAIVDGHRAPPSLPAGSSGASGKRLCLLPSSG